jgi:hypothetical protein
MSLQICGVLSPAKNNCSEIENLQIATFMKGPQIEKIGVLRILFADCPPLRVKD